MNAQKRRVLVDISEIYKNDARTGVQRITRGLIINMMKIKEVEIIPIYLTENSRFFCAVDFPAKENVSANVEVKFTDNDIFLGLDLNYNIITVLPFLKRRKTFFIVYDMIPITHPYFFYPLHALTHWTWFREIVNFEGVIGISKFVANEIYAINSTFHLNDNLKIGWFHCGYDIENTLPTKGIPPNGKEALRILKSKPTFLMVGTIEPRKAYPQVLKAFEKLWKEGYDVNLVFVGKKGWPGKEFSLKDFINYVENHPLRGKNLFWFDRPSDEFLEQIYRSSTCLIQASYVEGFGLPIVEAAKRGIPLILRDIPVFREIAGKHAFYFEDSASEDVVRNAVKDWLKLYKTGSHPKPDKIKIPTWKEAAEKVLDIILNDRWETNLEIPLSWPKVKRELKTFEEYLSDNEVIVFGASGGGRKALKTLKRLGISVKFFLDNDPLKTGKEIEGIPIKHPSQVDFSKLKRKILIASMWREEIAKQLEGYGLKEWIDFF